MSVKYQPSLNQGNEIESPCVRNCCLNDDDICLGCFRHMNEIMAWRQLDETTKKTIINQCQERRKKLSK